MKVDTNILAALADSDKNQYLYFQKNCEEVGASSANQYYN